MSLQPILAVLDGERTSKVRAEPTIVDLNELNEVFSAGCDHRPGALLARRDVEDWVQAAKRGGPRIVKLEQEEASQRWRVPATMGASVL